MKSWILTIHAGTVAAYDGKVYTHFKTHAELAAFGTKEGLVAGDSMMCSSTLDFPEEYGMTAAAVAEILGEAA